MFKGLMSDIVAIDFCHKALAGVGTSDGVLSVFRLDSPSPLASCQAPHLLGSIRRVAWAPFSSAPAAALAVMLVADCDHGCAVFDFVDANYTALRLRNVCILPSSPHSQWLSEDRPTLAVALSTPGLCMLWPLDGKPCLFSHVRGALKKAGVGSQYCIHWKREAAAREAITLWPSMLTCELSVEASVLVMHSPYSSLIAYSDALFGGLFVGTLSCPSAVVLPDVSPLRLQWLRNGSLICEAESFQRRKLLVYDEALNELFSFIDTAIPPDTIVYELELSAAQAPQYKTVESDLALQLPLYDDVTDFAVSACGGYIAVKSSRVLSIWDVNSGSVPQLLGVYDHSRFRRFKMTWSRSEVPWLFTFSDGIPYLCLYRVHEDPIAIRAAYVSPITDIYVTYSESVVICYSDRYEFVSADRLFLSETVGVLSIDGTEPVSPHPATRTSNVSLKRHHADINESEGP